MKRHHRTSFLIATFVLCLFAGTAQGASKPSPQDQIRRVLEDQVAAWNRGDIDSFMRGYWDSPDLIFTSGGNVRRGWQTTLENYHKSYPDRAHMGELSFTDLEIHLLTSPGDTVSTATAAWVLGRWRLKRADDEPHGIFTLIFRKFPKADGASEGAWKIIHDHTSSSR